MNEWTEHEVRQKDTVDKYLFVYLKDYYQLYY